ncbi:tRNA intron endonuclease [Phellopilus nigrolimitatus]|nr:tRNA intron endonuclease [Phellopilus nigrolimitatus]
MEKHPSFPAVSALAKSYPRAAGALLSTYNDLSLAQMWKDVEVVDIPSCSRGAFRGRRPNTDVVLAVVPCAMTELLSLDWIKGAFKDLGDPPEIFLGISTEDSSIVYYKISPGFAKPPL